MTQANKTILIVNDSLQKGGKERRMLELIKGLVAHQYKVVLVILTDWVEYDYVYELPIEFIIIKRQRKFEYAAYKKLSNILKQYKPAIIHSWGFVSSVYLGPLSKIYRVKFINGIIADSVQNLTIRNKFYLMSKISFPFSDRILSNSKAGIESYRAPKHKTQCIYNGLDLNRFINLKDKKQVINELLGNVAQSAKIVGMVAAFEPRKDYATLVKAAIHLTEKYNDLYFLLIGGGTMWEEIAAMVPNNLKNRIILTGKRSDIEAIVNTFNIGVLLTNADVHGEGISNSIIEYMALSKPVVATRGGGTDEVVFDGENGFRVDAFSVNQLTEKIEVILNNPKLEDELGKNARKLVESTFSLDKMTGAFIELYQTLTKN